MTIKAEKMRNFQASGDVVTDSVWDEWTGQLPLLMLACVARTR